jgi:cyclopropane-fatty-acyl-phospholipid synthase
MWYERALDWDVVPDAVLRRVVRARLANLLARLEREAGGDAAARNARVAARLRRQPVALHPDLANRQHYELPTRFFAAFLGPRMKYSACLWPPGVTDLAGAEEAMLALTCARAGIADGMEVLDLGCGWGSLALYVAERFPGCRVLAVSNSRTQGQHIAAEAARRGLRNVAHEVGDVNDYATGRRFDRVVSVEMLEHVRNYAEAFRRVRGWLAPDARVFAHVFSHRRHAYEFDGGDSDWMGRTFFSGGTMPSHDLFLAFQDDLEVVDRWLVDGTHYARTLEDWLARFDAADAALRPILADTYGAHQARRWRANWRLFFIACAETFAFGDGGQWGVSHVLFAPRDATWDVTGRAQGETMRSGERTPSGREDAFRA